MNHDIFRRIVDLESVSEMLPPRNIGIANDLAFLVQLQRDIEGIQTHMKGRRHHALEGSRQNVSYSSYSV